jgi:hypothetical protein
MIEANTKKTYQYKQKVKSYKKRTVSDNISLPLNDKNIWDVTK